MNENLSESAVSFKYFKTKSFEPKNSKAKAPTMIVSKIFEQIQSSEFRQILAGFNSKNRSIRDSYVFEGFCFNYLLCADVSGSCSSSPDCQHGGTCMNGTCTCPDGYSGTLCETGSLLLTKI